MTRMGRIGEVNRLAAANLFIRIIRVIRGYKKSPSRQANLDGPYQCQFGSCQPELTPSSLLKAMSTDR